MRLDFHHRSLWLYSWMMKQRVLQMTMDLIMSISFQIQECSFLLIE